MPSPSVADIEITVAACSAAESEHEMTLTHSRSGVALVAAMLLLSACSSGEDSGIASLDDPGGDPTASAAVTGTAEEQALAFAQCMRDNGVDFPDPTVNADGVPTFEDAFGRVEGGAMNPGDASFRDAQESCGSLMEGIAFGGGPGGPGGQFDASETADAMLPFTECLRDQGLDVGDLSRTA